MLPGTNPLFIFDSRAHLVPHLITGRGLARGLCYDTPARWEAGVAGDCTQAVGLRGILPGYLGPPLRLLPAQHRSLAGSIADFSAALPSARKKNTLDDDEVKAQLLSALGRHLLRTGGVQALHSRPARRGRPLHHPTMGE
ncbi:hypothetical protein CYMTET_37663 [Cymbomonas tetramitiformis]|uniref:Uncharacterized protein n=1 Tax=Cymbomonas tetramitiformis TaxID=36881 RepID=A0AAE0F6F8_9CHLO|nr:hypothetical protein CYMTET_37663 [Cymbomonas tetramitiformis]